MAAATPVSVALNRLAPRVLPGRQRLLRTRVQRQHVWLFGAGGFKTGLVFDRLRRELLSLYDGQVFTGTLGLLHLCTLGRRHLVRGELLK